MSAKLRKYPLLLLLLGSLWLTACNVSRFVPPDRYMLKKEVTVKGAKNLNTTNVIRLKPNRRMLVPKAYLSLYNVGTSLARDSSFLKRLLTKNASSEIFFNKTVDWLRKGIGERPVLISLEAIRKDSLNLRNAYAAKGFFGPEVNYRIDTINNWFEQKKANVVFTVKENKPFYIRRIHRDIQSWDLAYLYNFNFKQSRIRAGERFGYNELSLERARITSVMRDNGFFSFSPAMIMIAVDTILADTGPPGPRIDPVNMAPLMAVDSVMSVDSSKKWMDVTLEIPDRPTRFTIREIVVGISASTDTAGNFSNHVRFRAEDLSDSLREEWNIPQKRLKGDVKMTFLASKKVLSRLNFNFISERIHLIEEDIYRQSQARKTQNRLQELVMFQYVILNYELVDSLGVLDVYIETRLAPQYQFKGGFETYTNDITSANILPIIGVSLSLLNKNSFRRSDLWELGASGDIGVYPVNKETNNVFRVFQLKSSLNFPRFVLPFPRSFLPERYRELRRYRPVTTFSILGGLEQRTEFERSTSSANVNYRWFHRTDSQVEQSQFTPIALDFIDIANVDPGFQKTLDAQSPAIRRSFEPRFNSRLTYSYTVSDYATSRLRTTTFFRFTYEGGGNIPYLADLAFGESVKDHTLNGLQYGQYYKLSVEGKLFKPLGQGTELIVRGFLGGSNAWNFTPVVPPESRFYTGGVSSMRGWQSRTLGPGTFDLDDLPGAQDSVSSLFAIGGEYILEANIEYRFDVWSYIELALFTEVGNVWFNDKDNAKNELGEGSERMTLTRRNLYVGWDAGIGLRFDFSFLIVRLDLGQQIFSPSLVRPELDQKGWVVQFDKGIRGLGGRYAQWNIGIGYPF